jgi:hypothetical protein
MAVDASIFNGLIQPVLSVADYENAFAERANQKVKNALAMRQMALQEKEMSQHEAVQNALSQHGLTAAGADAVSRAGGVQGMEIGMKIRAQLEAQRKEQERQAALRSLMPVTGIDANKVSGVTGPRPEALGVVGQQQPFNPAQFLAAGMDPKQVEGIQALVAPKPKVKDYKEVRMPDGSVQLVGMTEDGRVISTGQQPFQKPIVQNFGGSIGGIDPATGRVTNYGATSQTPDSVARTGLGYAQLGETGRHNQVTEANATAKASKPAQLPTAALKMQQESLDAIGTASSINADLAAVNKQIEAGKLKFGPLSNLANRGLNAAGMSTEESRNFASFQATLEKLRNDSLRLNKGVQTDGDAQRAWNELFNNINDTGVVKQRLAEIQRINERAVQLHRLNVDSVRGNYGLAPYETEAQQNQTAAVGQGGAKSVVRTGTHNGRKVVQYSDGSMEYAK